MEWTKNIIFEQFSFPESAVSIKTFNRENHKGVLAKPLRSVQFLEQLVLIHSIITCLRIIFDMKRDRRDREGG